MRIVIGVDSSPYPRADSQIPALRTLGSKALVEVQIFGVKKNPDTRKALRFFAERRVRTHFVDLMVRAASPGALKRFAQKFGVDALVDRGSTRFIELGLAHAKISDVRWLEKLADDPMLLKMPLTRFASRLSVGVAEEEWHVWLQGMTEK